MTVRLVPRSQRVGGVDIAPGRSAIVRIGDPTSEDPRAGVSAWVGVGKAPGPRVSVVAAVHGFEIGATMAARALVREIGLGSLSGTLVVVPVFRPGDSFTRAGRRAPALVLPGDAGGTRRERLAFALHADVVVNADQVLVLGAPRPGRRSLLVAEAPDDDARSKKLAIASGAQAMLPATSSALLASALAAGRVVVRLCAGGAAAGVGADATILLAAVRRVLAALGAYADATVPGPAPRPCSARDLVRAPAGGVLEEMVEVGALVSRGDLLARWGGAIPGQGHFLLAPSSGLVLESPATPMARRGAVLFVIGRSEMDVSGRRPRATLTRVGPDPSGKLRAGWFERVSLPDLGIGSVPAKIDTGAGTSALHVISSRVVGRAAGPSRRPILELTLPAGGSSRRRLIVRAPVKEFIEVRDTSGRIERRPVIETTLALGPVRRRIRITLTDRGDMRCPMLVGRTGLGSGVVVDPSVRNLLGADGRGAPDGE